MGQNQPHFMLVGMMFFFPVNNWVYGNTYKMLPYFDYMVTL